jgi:hypothetical protein
MTETTRGLDDNFHDIHIKEIVIILVIISKPLKFMQILYEGLHMYAIIPCDFTEEHFL